MGTKSGVAGLLCYPITYRNIVYRGNACQQWFKNLYSATKNKIHNSYKDAQQIVYPDFPVDENSPLGLSHLQIVGNCVIYNLNVGTFIRFGEKNYYALKEMITGALAMIAQKGDEQYGTYKYP